MTTPFSVVQLLGLTVLIVLCASSIPVEAQSFPFSVGAVQSFELPTQGVTTSYYTYGPITVNAFQPWTFDTHTGIAGAGSVWVQGGCQMPPDGEQFAYLQNDASVSSSTFYAYVNGLTAGASYTVSFSLGYRWRTHDLTNAALTVTYNGGNIYSSSGASPEPFAAQVSSSFLGVSGSNILAFTLSSSDGQDRAALIDVVEINAV